MEAEARPGNGPVGCRSPQTVTGFEFHSDRDHGSAEYRGAAGQRGPGAGPLPRAAGHPHGDRSVDERSRGGPLVLSLSPQIQVFMAVEPVDLRKGFDGLSAAVQTVFDRQVLDGHVFLFLNRRRDRVKILWWDRDGLAIFYKRLERGSYEVPRHEAQAKHLNLDAT